MKKRQETVFQGHTAEVCTVAITSDNKYVVSGSADINIIVWNFEEKRREIILRGHLSEVNTLMITSDDKFIVSGSFDKTIII